MKYSPVELRLAMGSVCVILAVVMSIIVYNQAIEEEEFVDAGGCGPDQRYVGGNGAYATVCNKPGIRCINGYAKSDKAAVLPPVTTLPIRPKQFTNSPN
jgi:hypothetical protein